MDKNGLAAGKEHITWVNGNKNYSSPLGSDEILEASESAVDSAGNNLLDEIIDPFIDGYCLKQIKHRIPLKDLLNTIERVILARVLSRFNGHQKEASQFLRIKNTTLHEKLKRHNISISKTSR